MGRRGNIIIHREKIVSFKNVTVLSHVDSEKSSEGSFVVDYDTAELLEIEINEGDRPEYEH